MGCQSVWSFVNCLLAIPTNCSRWVTYCWCSLDAMVIYEVLLLWSVHPYYHGTAGSWDLHCYIGCSSVYVVPCLSLVTCCMLLYPRHLLCLLWWSMWSFSYVLWLVLLAVLQWVSSRPSCLAVDTCTTWSVYSRHKKHWWVFQSSQQSQTNA